jgi:hypothetical protein
MERYRGAFKVALAETLPSVEDVNIGPAGKVFSALKLAIMRNMHKL